MELEPYEFCRKLIEYSKNAESVVLCRQLLKKFDTDLQNEQTSSRINLYFIHLFNKTDGLLSFITNIVGNKLFNSCTKIVLEILYKFINNFNYKLEKYIVTINQICLKIVNSSITSATEKILAYNVLSLSFQRIHNCIENNDDYRQLYNTLIDNLQIRPRPTVKGKILSTLGVFAKNFPYLIDDNEKLQKIYRTELERQIWDKSSSIINGIFEGFTSYCQSFPLSNIDEQFLVQLFQFIENCLTVKNSNNVHNRAGLIFFAENMAVFSKFLIGKYQYFHIKLLEWFKYNEESKIVDKILVEFYRHLSQYDDHDIIYYFLNYFTGKLEDFDTKIGEYKTILQGLYHFSSVFHQKLTQQQWCKLYESILDNFDGLFVTNSDINDEDLEYLPDYLCTVIKFIEFQQNIDHVEIFRLQNGILTLIKTFPNLSIIHHKQAIDSVIIVLKHLQKYQKYYNDFVNILVYQSVLWTCSQQPLSEIIDDSDDKIVTFKNFMPFWNGVLSMTNRVHLDKFDVNLDDRQQILTEIIGRLLNTLFIGINKLNLSLEYKETDEPLTDIESTYSLIKINDFVILVNFVDFYEAIFNKIDPNSIDHCLIKMINRLINKCNENPLISGFYKLLSFILKIANNLDKFNENSIDYNDDCYNSLLQFFDILLESIQQFKDDLLIACLKVLLQYPIIIIRKSLQCYISVFILIFNIGRIHVPLTLMAIEKLEIWQNHIDYQSMESFLIEILPLLDTYLQSKSLTNFNQITVIKKKRKTPQPLHKRRISIELESELLKLQRRILNFIGQQNSKLLQEYVIDSGNNCNNNIQLTNWNKQQYLKLKLPYNDYKLDIYLEEFVPRLVNLALYCSDSKIRIASCELLHSTIMVFLGTSRNLPQTSRDDLNEFFRYICSAILQLGCDYDQLVCQMFEPLCLQIIHWFTHHNQLNSNHTDILIDTLMEGITHPTDSKLRDFSGKCIHEFTEWAIRQSKTRRNLINQLPIFKKFTQNIRYFSTHPDRSKKRGAALIFNNIYRLLREEEAIIQQYWIEYLRIFIKSLSLIHNNYNNDNDEIVYQINQSLKHLERVIVEKSSIFDNCKLIEICLWLLKQTGTYSWNCRQKSMELFCKITPKTTNFTNLQDFIDNNLNKSQELWINETYENYLQRYPTIYSLNLTEIQFLLKWLQSLTCALDGWIFMINNKLFKNLNSLSPTTFVSIDCFIKKIALNDLRNVLNSIRNNEWIITSFYQREFNSLKITIIRQILQLNRDEFWTFEFYTIIKTLIFQPELLNLNGNSTKIKQKILNLLENIIKQLPKQQLQQLCSILDGYIKDNNYLNFNLKHITLKQRNLICGLLFLQSLNLDEINLKQLSHGNIDGIMEKFLVNSKESIIVIDNLQDTVVKHCSWILQFSLNYDEQFEIFINYLYKEYNVQRPQISGVTNFGLYILDLFRDVIIDKILRDFELFIKLCKSNNNVCQTIALIQQIINYLLIEKLDTFKNNVYKILLDNWTMFEEYFDTWDNFNITIKFIQLLLNLSKTSNDVLVNYLIKLLINKNMTTNQRIEVIGLIVGTIEVNHPHKELRQILNSIRIDIFPTITESIFNKFLLILQKTKTVEFFEFTIKAYLKLDIDRLDSKLEKFLQNSSDQLQEDCLNTLIQISNDENDNFQPLELYKLIPIINQLFKSCKLEIFEQYYINNIKKIIEIVENTPNNLYDLFKAILQFTLIELLFLRLPLENNDETTTITQSISENFTNKQLLQKLLGITLKTFKMDLNELNNQNQEFVRLYRCASYNCSVSIICNSIKNPKFYEKLFNRQDNNDDILWTNLIDLNRNYCFSSDFKELPERRKILINIRNNIKTIKRNNNINVNTIKYLQTQRFLNNTLSEDITKFDFSNTNLRDYNDNNNDNSDIIQTEIELENVEINKHECIGHVCGLIQHLIDNKINDNEEIPFWILTIRNLLINPQIHSNIKIFWIQIINNMKHAFKYYSKHLLEPILKFIVDKCAGGTINYFVLDVIVLLASFSTEIKLTTPKEIELLSDLIEFLIENINNTRRDIFKYQLELFRVIIESWSVSIKKLPYDLILTKLDNEIGIHLSSILFVNNLQPWQDQNGFQLFCKKLFKYCTDETIKNKYKPAVETVGLFLKYLNDNQSDKLERMLEEVRKLLKRIDDSKKLDKYITCLEAIVLHYPKVLDEYNLIRLLNKLQAIPSPVVILKILLEYTEILGKINEFRYINWCDYLDDDNKHIQYLTLDLIYKTLNVFLSEKQFKNILKSICKHSTNIDVPCRDRMYDILISLKIKQIKDDEIDDIIHPILINGLIENEKLIREKIYQFWETQSNLPVDITNRFIFLLKYLYTINNEDDFLGYTSYLLLSILKMNDNRLLFEQPLENCVYNQQKLEKNPRSRYSTFTTPMFTQTLQSQSIEHYDRLKQTQQVFEFEPTQTLDNVQQITSLESSLFINNNNNNNDDGDDSGSNEYTSTTISTSKYQIPVKRFLADKTKIRRQFADNYRKKSILLTQQRHEQIKQKDNQVDIMRNYRKGDFPDIQIQLFDIINPLMLLILHDYELSKIVYISIFKNILIQNNLNDFLSEISNGILNIFIKSKQYNTNLFRILFELILSSDCNLIFDINLLTKISESSGLITMGSLILEEYLNKDIYNDDQQPCTSKKRRDSVITPIKQHWIKLAQLYKTIEEWDVVKAIFLTKIDHSDLVTTALKYESQKLWLDAQNIYKQLIQNDDQLEAKDFYYESYFKCFAHLSEWTKLTRTIENFVNNNDNNQTLINLFDNDWNQQKLLPWYINGKLKTLLLENDGDYDRFLDDLKNSEYIRNNFAEELCLLLIDKDETDVVKYHLQTYIDNFLHDWQLLDPIYFQLRFNKLLKLHNVVDINKFIKVYENLNNIDDGGDNKKLENLLNYWRETNRESLPTILLNETRILYRIKFTNLLMKKHQVSQQLKDFQYRSYADLIDESIKHQNYYFAEKYYKTKCQQIDSLHLQLSLSKINYLKATTQNNVDIDILLENMERLNTILQSDIDMDLKLSTHRQLFDNLIEIGKIESNDNNKIERLSKILNNPLINRNNINIVAVENFQKYLKEYEKNCINDTMETNDFDFNLKKKQQINDCFIKLMYFAKDCENFTNFLFYTLKAMQYESIEARQFFPLILIDQQLFDGTNQKVYLDEITTIPDWMFLIWIPQLLIHINTDKLQFVSTILERITKRYPQSIIYNYRLSKEHYNETVTNETLDFINKLDGLLLDYKNGVDDILKALSFVAFPSKVLSYYIKKMQLACSVDDNKQFDDIYSQLNDDYFDREQLALFRGRLFNKFDDFKVKFEKLPGLNKQERLTMLQEINTKIPKDENSKLLKHYSPWLENFIADNLDIELEIPGQYHGKRIPLPQYHTKISRFLEYVTPMDKSLRKPIKLTILGNNMRQYPFLVKFGEDVRQDQRIQQLFNLMNDIFDSDIMNRKQLTIDTYQVIPLKTNLGIIEWVENTIKLQDFVMDTLPKSEEIFEAIQVEYMKWIGTTGDQIRISNDFGRAIIKYNRNQTITKYRSLVHKIPSDIMRSSLIKLSSSMDSFFALRTNFIKSHSVLCTSHWLLGIGDRHLSNLLISIKTGRIIGIDFGFAFGIATQLLPVPELVPFRLTPHIIDLMLPLRECGIFKETMLHCLKLLRSNKSKLLSTMKIFIEEPTIDWCDTPNRLNNNNNNNTDWYPLQKIQQAQKKLDGASSVVIMIEDLKTSRQQDIHKEAYIELVRGSSEDNRRKFSDDRQLSVEEQVECLLDHAMDHNLLGRMYYGWTPWV